MLTRSPLTADKSDAKRENVVGLSQGHPLSPSIHSPVGRILSLQRAIGNRMVRRLAKGPGQPIPLFGGGIRPKLRVGRPGDRFEQEADEVADAVLTMPAPPVQRQGQQEQTEDEEAVRASEAEEEPVEDNDEASLQPKLDEGSSVLPQTEEGEESGDESDGDEDVVQAAALPAASLIQLQEDEEPEDTEDIHTKSLEIADVPSLQSLPDAEAELEQEGDEEEIQTKTVAPKRPVLGFMRSIGKSAGALLRKGAGAVKYAGRAIEDRLARASGSGHSLPTPTRAFMEPRFNADFGQVQIHTGSEAVQMSQALSAKAFTHRSNIYFGENSFQPGTSDGDRLIAHELAHVVQQGAAIRPQAPSVDPQTPQIQGGFWSRVKKKFKSVAKKVAKVAKRVGKALKGGVKWLVGKLAPYAQKIPGYSLLSVVLGKDPITGRKVKRDPVNLLGEFLGLIPGGSALFESLNKTGAIDSAVSWMRKEIAKLGLSWSAIKALFGAAVKALSAKDLLSPKKAWGKIKKIFGPPLKRIKDFVLALGNKILSFVFDGALATVGAPVKKIRAILAKGKGVLTQIIRHPIQFVKNLTKAIKGGISQFKKNIVDHLKAGVIGWLVGTLSDAGIELPEKFDLKGIVSLVLQIMGVSYQSIRAKAVKKAGPKGEAVITWAERAVPIVQDLIKRGPVVLWEYVKAYAANLKEKFLGAVIGWVRQTIVFKAIEKLISLFNPAGAIIQAVIAIYNTVMFFVERANQIADFVKAVFDSIAEIVAGVVSKAANAIESALSRAVPVVISFLARLIGLGGISSKIQQIVKKIRTTVDPVVDRVVDVVVTNAMKLYGKVAGIGDEVKPDADPEKARKLQRGFVAIEHEEHRLAAAGGITRMNGVQIPSVAS